MLMEVDGSIDKREKVIAEDERAEKGSTQGDITSSETKRSVNQVPKFEPRICALGSSQKEKE